MQFHGIADRYTLNGATAIATLYSNATTATANPAVTMRNGRRAAAGGGVHLRPGAIGRLHAPGQSRRGSGQERDGIAPIRSDDLFFGAKAGDVQPDWVDFEQDRDSAGRRAAAAAL